MPHQNQTCEHIHYDINNINFAITEEGINCTVSFDSSHPDTTGSEISRLFDPEVTIMEILQYHIEDFPVWDQP